MENKCTDRIDWIDTLKAIGLFFVVLGHTVGIDVWLHNYIFSFHIPLFFFISGYLVKPESLTYDFSWILRRHFRSLILPYWVFGTITYVTWILIADLQHFQGREIAMIIEGIEPVVGMLSGNIYCLRHNWALWFIPALFSLHIIYYWLHKHFHSLGLVTAIILLSFVGGVSRALKLLPFQLPWGIETACVGLAFYGVGQFFRKLSVPFQQIKPLCRCAALVISLAIQVVGVKANGQVNLSDCQLGNRAVFYLVAFNGICFWSLVSQVVPPWRIFRAVSQDSVIIFSFNFLCFSIFDIVANQKILHFPQSLKQSSLMAVLYTAATFALLLPFAPYIRKVIPWLEYKKRCLSL